MIAPRRPTRAEAACRSKVRFASAAVAARTAVRIPKKGLSVYQCLVCGAWHITSKRDGNGSVRADHIVPRRTQ